MNAAVQTVTLFYKNMFNETYLAQLDNAQLKMIKIFPESHKKKKIGRSNLNLFVQ